MSDCARIIEWAGGTHTFDLGHPWIAKVLSFRGFPGSGGSSPAACLARFENQNYTADDIEAVIRLGLIGGGMDEAAAQAVIINHVYGKPLGPLAIIAFEVLGALFVGKPDAISTDEAA